MAVAFRVVGVILLIFPSIVTGSYEETYRHYLAPANIFDDEHIWDKTVIFSIETKDKIYKTVTENYKTFVFCVSGTIVPLMLNLKKAGMTFKMPFNVSCEMVEPRSIITNLTVSQQSGAVHLAWNISVKGTHIYLINFINNESYFHTVVSRSQSSYSLENASYNTVCISTINSQWRTSKYICSQDLFNPAPVIDLRAYSTSHDISICWEKSDRMEEIHHGYVVHVTYPNGRVKCMIIHMKKYCVSYHKYCHNAYNVWLSSLQPIKIGGLTPDTMYNISIFTITEHGQSITKSLSIRTTKDETVTNIRASLNGSKMTIEFNAPHDPSATNVVFRLKVTLNKINMCAYKYRVIFDDVINTTSKSVNVSYWTSCSDYLIEVTPVRSYVKSASVGTTTSIVFKPMIKRNATAFLSIDVNLLSLIILKLFWNGIIVEDECTNFGVMVQSTNVVNASDCKTWIVTKKTCKQLIDTLSGISNCKTEEYLRIENGVIKSSLLLHAQFLPSAKYRIKMWAITDSFKLILNKIIQYRNGPECFVDCYNATYTGLRSASHDGRLCLPWKEFSNVTKKGNYRSNICQGEPPKCIINDHADQTECAIPKCSSVLNGIKCVTRIDVLLSRESITLMWSSLLTTEENVHGYITLLHTSDNDCERYHIQTCTECIQLLRLSTPIQSFYQSCRSGSVVNEMKYETTFEGLQPNKEYVAYIIPLINITSVGEIRQVTIGTRVSDILNPIYIKISNKTTTSIQFQWEDYISNVNYYKSILIGRHSNYKVTIKSINEMVLFNDLDMCAEYCLHHYVNNESGQLEFIDTVCAYTLAPSPRNVRLNDVKSGPTLERVISWTYSECSTQYRLEYRNQFLNRTFIRITNDTNIILNNLERNTIYTVKVRAETMNIDVENNVNVGNYSEQKEFYTGLISQNITVNIEDSSHSKDKVTLHWRINDHVPGWMFEFIIQFGMKGNSCLESVNFVCTTSNDRFTRKFISTTLARELNTLLSCSNVKSKSFSLDTTEFSYSFVLTPGLDKINVTLYGLDLLGLHKLYENVI